MKFPVSSTSTGNRNYQHTGTGIGASVGAGRPPMRVLTLLRHVDVPLPLKLDLGFSFISTPLPTSPTCPTTTTSGSTSSAKGKSSTASTTLTPVEAKLESLEDATSFLEFLIARRRLGKWTSITIKKHQQESATSSSTKINPNSPWHIHLSLERIGFDRPQHLITVAASPNISSGVNSTASKNIASKDREKKDKTPEKAELCAKQFLIRALINPRSSFKEFVDLIDPTLWDKEAEDLGGKEFFALYRATHPRTQLTELARKFRNGIGSNDFMLTTERLIAALKNGVLKDPDGDEDALIGFGRWVGEVDTALKICLSVSSAFPLSGFRPVSLSILTLISLLHPPSYSQFKALHPPATCI